MLKKLLQVYVDSWNEYGNHSYIPEKVTEIKDMNIGEIFLGINEDGTITDYIVYEYSSNETLIHKDWVELIEPILIKNKKFNGKIKIME